MSGEKETLIEFTQKHPEVFQDFKKTAAKEVKSLPDSEFESINVGDLVDHLVSKLRSIPKGTASAGAYHTLMIGILEFIFYPNLINPVKEQPINDARKRIDICVDNAAPSEGFFHRLQHAHNIPCPYIFVECKNYSNDVANPELDQMVGRFSPNRGKFGIITCRDINNEPLFLKRCSDSFTSQHGLIIPLTDNDIISILEQKKAGVPHPEENILDAKTRIVIL